MKRMKKGQGMAEYAFVVGLVAIVAIGVLSRIGLQIKETYTIASDAIRGSVPASPPSDIAPPPDDDDGGGLPPLI